jgi:hypothetical protein
MRIPKQFSLRTFAVFVLLLSIALAYWVSRTRDQRSAAQAIRAIGGRVTYDSPPRYIPQFLLVSLGDDYFCRVNGITLYPTAESDADSQIRLLKDLPALQRVAIWPGIKGRTNNIMNEEFPGGVTDQGVDFLTANLPNLRHLSLLFTRTSPAGEERLLATKRIASLQFETHSDVGKRSGGRDRR